MVLLIDNYDSFTFNLYDYIKQIGKECKVIRNDELNIKEIELLDFSSIVISPGPGIPKNAGLTMEIIENFHKQKPILGICLGHQAIGQFFGNKLVKAKLPMHGKTSKLVFAKHLLFDNINEYFNVMRYHSLVLDRIKLPLKTIAVSEGEIMAVEHDTLPIIGVQFHPESILTENGLLILDNFFNKIIR